MLPEARNDFEAEAQAVGESLAEVLCNGVNRHCKHQIAIGFARKLLHTHRTLQQAAVSSLAEALVAFAKESEDFTDMRNEHVVKKLNTHNGILREIAAAPFV